MMNVDMIEDIVKAIKKKYGIDEVDVSYDLMPVDAESVLAGIEIVLDDEFGEWSATGEMWVIRSMVGNDTYIQILLLKRGVEIEFIIPQSLSER